VPAEGRFVAEGLGSRLELLGRYGHQPHEETPERLAELIIGADPRRRSRETGNYKRSAASVGRGLPSPHMWSTPYGAEPAVAAAAGHLVGIACAAVRGFGLTEQEQDDAVRTLCAAVTGFLALEHGGGYQLARDPDTSFKFLVKVLARGLVSA
jgi:hypothetical protein